MAAVAILLFAGLEIFGGTSPSHLPPLTVVLVTAFGGILGTAAAAVPLAWTVNLVIEASRKGMIKSQLGLQGLEHTHHAGEDAQELAGVFEAVLKHAVAVRSATASGSEKTERPEQAGDDVLSFWTCAREDATT